MTLVAEQIVNGLQLGVMLFLISAGLTLVFGVMGLVNLTHGSLYMIGAYVGATVVNMTSSFILGGLCAIAAAAAAGVVVEFLVLRKLYHRSFLDQVLATYGLILFFNQGTTILWGRQPIYTDIPALLSSSVDLLPGFSYQVYRLFIIAVGLAVAAGLYYLIVKTRVGMLIRAGATHRDMVRALGIRIRLLYTAIFGLGCTARSASAGFLAAPISPSRWEWANKFWFWVSWSLSSAGLGRSGGHWRAQCWSALWTLSPAHSARTAPISNGSKPSKLAAPPPYSSIVVYLLMAIILIWRPKRPVPGEPMIRCICLQEFPQ